MKLENLKIGSKYYTPEWNCTGDYIVSYDIYEIIDCRNNTVFVKKNGHKRIQLITKEEDLEMLFPFDEELKKELDKQIEQSIFNDGYKTAYYRYYEEQSRKDILFLKGYCKRLHEIIDEFDNKK